jgi:hypothetical protein
LKKEQSLPNKVTVEFPVIFRHGAGYDEIKLGSLKNGHEKQMNGRRIERNTKVIENFGN